MSLKGRAVLITAGPTREPLDPVRYLSNSSSGKMGYALAAAARRRGARVLLVTGPTALAAPSGVRAVRVTTAREMLAACLRALPGTDLVIGAAAVADWRPARVSAGKLKKRAGGGAMTLRLTPNPDILAALAARRTGGRPRLVGFALETSERLARARDKMRRKGLDMIVANGPEALDGDRSTIDVLLPDGRRWSRSGTKAALADEIVQAAEALG